MQTLTAVSVNVTARVKRIVTYYKVAHRVCLRTFYILLYFCQGSVGIMSAMRTIILTLRREMKDLIKAAQSIITGWIVNFVVINILCVCVWSRSIEVFRPGK